MLIVLKLIYLYYNFHTEIILGSPHLQCQCTSVLLIIVGSITCEVDPVLVADDWLIHLTICTSSNNIYTNVFNYFNYNY